MHIKHHLEIAKKTNADTDDRVNAITSIVDEIKKAYANPKPVSEYPKITDAMTELLEIANDHTERQDEVVRIAAIESFPACLYAVACAKGVAEKNATTMTMDPLLAAKLPKLNQFFKETQAEESEWAGKVYNAAVFVKALEDIANFRGNTSPVKKAAAHIKVQCEHEYRKILDSDPQNYELPSAIKDANQALVMISVGGYKIG